MSKRTIATSWEVTIRDETGAMVNIGYTCPYCHYDTGELISIGAGDRDKIDSGFETDQECSICGEAIIVECR